MKNEIDHKVILRVFDTVTKHGEKNDKGTFLKVLRSIQTLMVIRYFSKGAVF